MHIGLQIWRFDWNGSPENIGAKNAEIAKLAEDAGFYSLWVMDHYFQMEQIGDPSDPMLEAYSTLSYLAGVTKKVKLGALVTGVIYRQPAFLVKQVTTLDVLSGGRAYLGIGAAWYEREAKGLGFPFPSVSDRFEMLEETLQIAHHMWADNTDPFEGKHYTLEEPINHPQPTTKPHPPIMIGGMGEKKTLRFVAKYADATNLFMFAGMDTLRHKLEVLKGHCETEGRSYDDIEKTVLGSFDFEKQSTDELLEQIKELADMGVTHAIFNIPHFNDLSVIEEMGKEVIPTAAEL